MVVFLASFAMIFGLLYTYFSNAQAKQLKTETAFVAQGVENGGLDYLSSLESGEYRITWVAADGTVLLTTRRSRAAWKTTWKGKK